MTDCALLGTGTQQYVTEFELQERAKAVFADCDGNVDGKLNKQDVYNFLVDRQVNLSHITQEKLFRQLSGGAEFLTLPQFLQGLGKYSRILASGLDEPAQLDTDSTKQLHNETAEFKLTHQMVNFSSAVVAPAFTHQSHDKVTALPAGAALEKALSQISNASNKPGNKGCSLSCTMKSSMKGTMKSTGCSEQSVNNAMLLPSATMGRQMTRLATRKLEKEQAERAERIRAHNLHTAMQPLKQVLYQIDDSGTGRMSYHDFYLFLERTNPHMLPAASSIFFTLDKRMDGEVRYKDILRVLYPHALDKELAEMLTVVARKKQVKGQNNLEQQVAELKEVFAVYDEDGTGQLKQAEFVQAIISAGYDYEEAVQMFDIVDGDNGGSVSLEEFVDWFLHNETGKDKTQNIPRH